MKYCLLASFLFLLACKNSIKPEQLYGDWKYISVIKPNGIRPDTLSEVEIEVQNPSIHFTKKNQLYIIWGGEKFSEGTFTIDGDKIQYTEKISAGTRTFPFRILNLEENKIVFETTNGGEATRVTAERISK